MLERIGIDAATAAEARAFIGEIEALAATVPSSHLLPVAEQRAGMAAGCGGSRPRLVCGS